MRNLRFSNGPRKLPMRLMRGTTAAKPTHRCISAVGLRLLAGSRQELRDPSPEGSAAWDLSGPGRQLRLLEICIRAIPGLKIQTWGTRQLCYPRSENPDLGHPALVVIQGLGLFGAGPVDSRTTSSGAMTISAGYFVSRLAMRSRRTCAPRLPISKSGWRTVVREGVE